MTFPKSPGKFAAVMTGPAPSAEDPADIEISLHRRNRSSAKRVFCWNPSLCVESIRSLEDRVLDGQKNAWKRNDDWAARQAKSLIARCHERGGQVTWRDVAFLLRAAEGRKLMRRMTTMVIVGERGR